MLDASPALPSGFPTASEGGCRLPLPRSLLASSRSSAGKGGAPGAGAEYKASIRFGIREIARLRALDIGHRFVYNILRRLVLNP